MSRSHGTIGGRRQRRARTAPHRWLLAAIVALVVGGLLSSPADGAAPAQAETERATPARAVPTHAATEVRTEARLRAVWADPMRRRIDLAADIVLRDCDRGDPVRETPYPLLLDGHGHSIRQTCFENRVLRQDGTGYLDLRRVSLMRGGSDGPGAALTSRGEISLSDCSIKQNLAEEPGGGVFSMRRVTARRCHINGNLANDDGGGIYARRGGVQVYDSVLSANLVDGSGGAIASTGDVLVVRSRIDGNTTDGDGGALYADEDGDVTVIDSLVDGSDADGPGGAIFTLDGDVAVLGSMLIGNRADDRGGAISGEADVLVVNSTIARNLAVAHVGGGVWARGDLVLVNATVTNNYAEGAGGGVMAAGATTLVSSTLTRNIGSVAANVGAAGPFTSFASIIGPAVWQGVTGDTIPTKRSCRVYQVRSLGHNLTTDASCGLGGSTDLAAVDPLLAELEDDPAGFVLAPKPDSPVRSRVPSRSCRTRLPSPLPAGQLLARWVSWDKIVTHDAVGRPRGSGGAACDIGAVQSAPPAAVAPAAILAVPAPVDDPDAGTPATQATRTGPARDRSDAGPARATRTTRAMRAKRPLRASLRRMEKRLRSLDRGAARFDRLLRCTTKLGIARAGGRGRGFLYDERDGTGVEGRRALVRTRSGPTWRLLRLSPSRRCASAAPDPNGSGADARVARVRRPATVGSLRKAFRRLERIEERVEERTERFDTWESCLAWLPVTEHGDAEQGLGYRVDPRLAPGRRSYSPAVDLDRGRWDDPDYQVLAVRPKRRGCGRGPGESADRLAPRRSDDSREDLRQDLRSMREDVEDLVEPVGDIVRFDECMYTVGMRQTQGYLYKGAGGRVTRRPALSFDMRGHRLPRINVLAFPGEEPPQIECNEDAGGQETDE